MQLLFLLQLLHFDPVRIGNFYNVTISGNGIITQNDVTNSGSGQFIAYKWLYLDGNFDAIDGNAFSLCSNLIFVNLTNVKLIKTRAFFNSQITTLILGDTLTAIDSSAFSGNPIPNLTLPKTLTTIGAECFYKTKIDVLTFEPDSVLKSIGGTAFGLVPIREFINWPDSIETIGYTAFDRVLITEFIIGANLRSFSGSIQGKNLIKIVNRNNLNFAVENNNIVYSSDYKTLHFVPLGTVGYLFQLHQDCLTINSYVFYQSKVQTVELNQRLYEIKDFSFQSCLLLTTIIFPESLQIIGSSAFKGSGLSNEIILPNNLTTLKSAPFSGCKSLTKLICENNTNFKSDDRGILYDLKTNIILWCPYSLTHLIMPNDITIIQDSTFTGCQISTVSLSTSLKTIGSFSFQGCKLHYLFIPKSVTHLYSAVFSGNPLESVDFEDNSQIIQIGNGCFMSISTLISFNLGKNSSLESIALYPFQGTGIISFVFPPTLKTILSDAFKNCFNLENITFTSNVEIGLDAFANCNKLNIIYCDMISIGARTFSKSGTKTLIFSNKIEEIGAGSFSESYNLEEIIFEKQSNLKIINSLAFSNCDKLEKVNLPLSIERFNSLCFGWSDKLIEINIVEEGESEEEILKSRFISVSGIVYSRYNINKTLIAFPSGLNSVKVEIGTKILGKSAFDSCSKLENVYFNQEIEEISDNCFVNCISLEQINIPISVQKIGINPFEGCLRLKYILFCGESDKLIESKGTNIIREETSVIVKSEYIGDLFLNHGVIKSTSINDDKCPNIPTSVFSTKKQTKHNEKLFQLYFIHFLNLLK